MKYAFFLGCLIPQRIPSIELAARGVFERLEIEVAELEGYTCCPDPIIARLVDRKTSLMLSARNMSLAERLGLDLMVICNGCYETLVEAGGHLRRDPELVEEINRVLARTGKMWEGKARVKHVVEVLHEDIGINRIGERVERQARLKLAVHPGCHLFKEPDGGDPWRKPKQLEELVLATGARVVGRECRHNRLCCGFPMMQASEEFALKRNLLSKLECYQALGVDGIIVPCPTCCLQIESGQVLLRKYGARFNIPCMHVLELLALALGFSTEELALDIHRSPVEELARKVIGSG